MLHLRTLPLVFTLVAATTVLVVVLGVWRRFDAQMPTIAFAAPTVAPATLEPPTPFPTWTPRPTFTPTATPAPPPTPTPIPVPVYLPAAPATTLVGISHEWQTWNNCGPATLAMYMSAYGSTQNQATIGAVLRPFPDDKNVSPHELAAYAEGQGYRAALLVGGNRDLMRTLLSNGFPVLVETWHEDEPNNGMGHYRLLAGYDDALARWIVYDSYDRKGLIAAEPYAGLSLPYDELDTLWKVFNRTYLLVYPPEQAPTVESILADFGVDSTAMWQTAAARAQADVAANPGDVFGWFNLGSSLVAQGQYADAAFAYDQARGLGWPWRMLWYQFGPFEAYLAMGRYEDVLALADATLAVVADIEEVHYWRGRALSALGDRSGADLAWQRALALNPTFAPAQIALGQMN
jgi:tetratricopeptide (TPR) repeat protein